MPIRGEKIYITVRFRNQVNTIPSPHIVVRNEGKDTGSAVLFSHYIRFIGASVWGGAHSSAGIVTPLLLTQPKDTRSMKVKLTSWHKSTNQ